MVMAVCVVLYVNENCGPIKIFIPPTDRMSDIIDAANSKMHCMVQPMNILIRDYGTMKWMDEDGLHYNKCDKKDPEMEKQIRGMSGMLYVHPTSSPPEFNESIAA